MTQFITNFPSYIHHVRLSYINFTKSYVHLASKPQQYRPIQACPAENKEYAWNINNVCACVNMLEIEKLDVKYFRDEHWQLLCFQFLDLLNLQVFYHYTDLSRELARWFIKNGTYTKQTVNLFLIGCEMTITISN